ncbi:MAG: hypothetical protein V3V08_07530 [Nannocystaceae bacterium]
MQKRTLVICLGLPMMFPACESPAKDGDAGDALSSGTTYETSTALPDASATGSSGTSAGAGGGSGETGGWTSTSSLDTGDVDEDLPAGNGDDWAEVGDCADSIVPTGVGVGDVVHDVVGPDQFGTDVRLHAQCHRGVFLEIVADW